MHCLNYVDFTARACLSSVLCAEVSRALGFDFALCSSLLQSVIKRGQPSKATLARKHAGPPARCDAVPLAATLCSYERSSQADDASATGKAY